MPRHAQSLSSRYPTALVTGASSGLGRAIADALLREGLRVYGTTRNPRPEGLNPKIEWLTFEGTDKELVADWIRVNGVLLDNIGILVNNCGAGLFGDITSVDSAQQEGLVQLMLGTPMALTKAVLPGMRKNSGAVVNVSSLAAEFPLPFMPGYTSAKAGLSAFTQSLMLTESRSEVLLIDFQPGDFKTAFNNNTVRTDHSHGPEAIVWAQIDKLLNEAPEPERGAKDLLKALKRGKGGIVRSGRFFQAHLAPLGNRILPRKWLLGFIRRYYKLAAK